MHRTTPVVTNTPSVSQTYKTAILSEFKGIDETVNPFSAVKNSAKECTNLYIDDEGTLVTRPRVEYVQKIPTTSKYYKTFKLYDPEKKWFWVSVYTNPYKLYVKTQDSDEFVLFGFTSGWSDRIENIKDFGAIFDNEKDIFIIGNDDTKTYLYTVDVDFVNNQISLNDPLYYIPTSQIYDLEADTYYALSEQGNLWTSESSAAMYWSIDALKSTGYRKRNFKILKNEYYDHLLTYSNDYYTRDFLMHDYISTLTATSGNGYKCEVLFADGSKKEHTVTVAQSSGVASPPVYDKSYNLFMVAVNKSLYVFKDDTSEPTDHVLDSTIRGVDISKKVVICHNTIDSNFSIYIYNGTGNVELKKTISVTNGSTVKSVWIDSLHSIAYLFDSTQGLGCINYSDLENIVYTKPTQILYNYPFADIIFYDTKNNLTYVELSDGGTYIIDKDGTISRSDYNTNIGTTDRLYVDESLHLMAELHPENATIDNGKIGLGNGVDGMTTRVSVNGNILAYYEASTWWLYFIFKYKNDTAKPLMYISMPIDADKPTQINRVSRYNNNFVFWSTKNNTVYFTKYNDPTYIPESYYDTYGGSDAVKGVLRISDDYLAVFKTDQTFLTKFKDDLFYSNELRAHAGCSYEESCIVCNYSNIPIMVNNNGVWSLGQSSSVTYQDTVFGSISDRIDKGFTEYLPDKYILHNHKYYTYIGYNRDDSGIIWVYDNRIGMWFKWVLPITITDFIEIDDVTYIVSTYSDKYNELYRLDPYGKQVDDDVQYLDEVHRATPNYKNINWKWVSQPLPLNTLNFKKRIKYLKLIFANKYESDHITFKYWFRTYTQTEYPTNPKTYTAEITTLKTQKLKPRIPRFDFLQIILESNNDSDQFEDGVGNTVSTTLNDKIGFVSIALNYLLLEG